MIILVIPCSDIGGFDIRERTNTVMVTRYRFVDALRRQNGTAGKLDARVDVVYLQTRSCVSALVVTSVLSCLFSMDTGLVAILF
jgi:hypothetical protein